jgi:hypothetical protein
MKKYFSGTPIAILACLMIFSLACSQNDKPQEPAGQTPAVGGQKQTPPANAVNQTPPVDKEPTIRIGRAEKAPLTLKLPEPTFEGTPPDFTTPNLDPKTGRLRPPFLAPKGAVNLALGKSVTASVEPFLGEVKQITDGDKEADPSSCVNLPEGNQWVQVDLGQTSTLYAVVFWHFHQSARVYLDVVVQVSDDPEFAEGVTTIFNNDHDNSSGHGVGEQYEYVETNEGCLADAKGAEARYVRIWSKGNTSNLMNHFIEVEVHGKPTG